MRKGWEYKKLGDCFSYIKNGANIKQKKDADGFPITRIETLSGGVFNRDRMGYAGIHDLSKYADYVLESKDLLMSHINSKTYIGRTVEYKRNNEETIIHGMNLLRLKAIHELIDSTFFAYYTQSGDFKSKIARIRKDAVNQSSFAISDLKRFDIPLPPKSTQLAIVTELDKINELIRLKKEQLKDFDNLAQSLFYEMFGDPVENENGWEVKKLKEIGEIKTGNTPSRSNDNFYNEKFIEWIKTDNIRNEQMNPTTAAEYLSRDGAECGRIVSKGSILVACIAGSLSSIGKCCITTKNVAFNQQINAITPYGDFCNSIYLYELIRNSYKYIQQNATTGMKHILSKSIFEKMKFPFPPLSLQRLFAQRIEQIEREKSEVQKSIQDLETLLASRMQCWFE